MIAMIEAARTAASPAGIWAVVIVALSALAFWLGALAIVSRNPGGRRRRAPDMPGPVLGGTHVSDCGRSVAPSRRSSAVFAADEADIYLARSARQPEAPAAAPATNVTVVPGQRTAGSPAARPGAGRPEMPAPRTGDADRPRPAATGSGPGSSGAGDG